LASSRGRSVSLAKLLLSCGIVSALTVLIHREIVRPHYFFSTGPLRELEVLEPYGLGNRVSRNFEELIVRHFFKDKKNGTFLDVGASHYQKENNT
jgi:hypothetical protein